MTSPGMSDRSEHAADILDKWADAIRGDWGSIDGRSCRLQLNEISTFLRGEQEGLALVDVGVCDRGKYGAHWADDFNDDHECIDH